MADGRARRRRRAWLRRRAAWRSDKRPSTSADIPPGARARRRLFRSQTARTSGPRSGRRWRPCEALRAPGFDAIFAVGFQARDRAVDELDQLLFEPRRRQASEPIRLVAEVVPDRRRRARHREAVNFEALAEDAAVGDLERLAAQRLGERQLEIDMRGAGVPAPRGLRAFPPPGPRGETIKAETPPP